MIRNHVTWAQELHDLLDKERDFEIITAPVLSLFTFRYTPKGVVELDVLNQSLVNAINDDGRIYLTPTRVKDNLVIRFQAGQVNVTREDVMLAFEVIKELAASLA